MVSVKGFFRKWLIPLLFLVPALMVWLPLLFLAVGSLMEQQELLAHLNPVFSDAAEGMATWALLPQFPTLQPMVELLLDTPWFFTMFWNTVALVLPILVGQLLIAVPAAWSFARYRFRGSRVLYFLYLALMVMPFQVTMVSSYLTLDKMSLVDTRLAVILPAIFSTFPVFLAERSFSAIPEAMLEAASLDGAGHFRAFMQIGCPLGMSGIMAAMVLGFIEYWGAIEQPMTFLKNPALYPLSLYLSDIDAGRAGISMAASKVMLIPPLLVFLYGRKDLEQGIQMAGMKG